MKESVSNGNIRNDQNGNIFLQKVMVVVWRLLYLLVRIFVLTNNRAFFALFQLLEIYRCVNENRLQLLSSLQKRQRFKEKDSLSSFIRIKWCCLALADLWLFMFVEWSEMLIFVFPSGLHVLGEHDSPSLTLTVFFQTMVVQRHDHEETCLYFFQSCTSQ